jgi:hypothetical protein
MALHFRRFSIASRIQPVYQEQLNYFGEQLPFSPRLILFWRKSETDLG